MNIEDYFGFCLAMKGVTEHFPFDEDTLVFKVGGKMFALSSLSNWESGTPSINLKCDPERAEELRAEYEAVNPGYHMSKVHWNTVGVNQDVPDRIVQQMIVDSYELILRSLPKRVQSEIVGEGS